MAEHFLYDEGIGRFVEQDDISPDNPYVVGNTSYVVLDLLRQRITDSPELAFVYLNEFTLPYLEKALKGINHVVDPYYRASNSLRLPPKDGMLEAASHAASVLSQIPDTYQPLGNKNYSRRGIFALPRTVFEHQQRIVEVGYIVEGIAQGQYDLQRMGDESLLRTLAYFQTASSLFKRFPQEGFSHRRNDGLLNAKPIDLWLPPGVTT